MANHFGLGDIRQRIGYIRVEYIPVKRARYFGPKLEGFVNLIICK